MTNYKVAISLREDWIEGRDEIRDSLDTSWKKSIEDLIGRQVLMFPIANHAESASSVLQIVQPNFIVLSGGQDTTRRHATEIAIIKYSLKNSLPMLGVCHGMQIINEYFGGSSIEVEGHVKKTHQVYSANTSAYSQFSVNSFHNFGIREDGLGKGLEPLWRDIDNHIESYKSRDHNILGIMWHPERYSHIKEKSQEWLSKYLREWIY